MRWLTPLPSRWLVRPRLALAAGAAAVLLAHAAADRRAARVEGATTLLVQATAPGADRREATAARLLDRLAGRPGVSGTRRVPPDELRDWLTQARVTPPGDPLPFPTVLEVRLTRPQDGPALAAALRAMPDVVVEGDAGRGRPGKASGWILEVLAAAALLWLATAAERASFAATAGLLRQLGAEPRDRIVLMLFAGLASAFGGAVVGTAVAAFWAGLPWAALGGIAAGTAALAMLALAPAFAGRDEGP